MPAKLSTVTTARIEFRPTGDFAAEPLPEFKTVSRSRASSPIPASSSTTNIVMKVLRRITAGIHPEIEIGRFLADVAHFAERPFAARPRGTGGRRSAQRARGGARYVENQGDAWSVTANGLNRLVEEQRLTTVRNRLPKRWTPPRCCNAYGRSAAAPPKCILPSPAAATRRDSSPNRSTPTTSASWTDAGLARARRCSNCCGTSRKELAEPAPQLAQASARSSRRHHPANRVGMEFALRRPEDPPSRRLPSRPGADRQGRRLYSRLRGRAAPQPRGAPRQGAAGARRRRLAALDRLRG